MRRAAWCALAVALWCAVPAPAQEVGAHDYQLCRRLDTAGECADKYFTNLTLVVGELLDFWQGRFERATWETDDDCQKVKAALLRAFDMVETAVNDKKMVIYFGTPNDSTIAAKFRTGKRFAGTR